MCLPCSLPCRHPDCGSQEGASLAISSPPAEAGFRTLSRPLFIQAGRLTWWNRWSPLLLLSRRETTSMNSIVSRQRPAALPTGRARSARLGRQQPLVGPGQFAPRRGVLRLGLSQLQGWRLGRGRGRGAACRHVAVNPRRGWRRWGLWRPVQLCIVPAFGNAHVNGCTWACGRSARRAASTARVPA